MGRSIRQGQLVTPFGVGAIVDIGSESFAIADISMWRDKALRIISDCRLAAKLHRQVKTPAGKEDEESVAATRFPKWHFCPRCRLMRMITGSEDEARSFRVPRCEKCKAEVTPMGFVSACADGHVSDVDWFYWAHSESGRATGVCARQAAELYFETSGRGGGDWSSIRVRCACGAKRSFAGLVQTPRPGGMRCGGRQPWLRKGVQCESEVQVYRRAASNLHFPAQVSAIDLVAGQVEVSAADLSGEWAGDPNFGLIKTLFAALDSFELVVSNSGHNIAMFAQTHGCTEDVAIDGLREALIGSGRTESEGDASFDSNDFQQQILAEEWQVLSSGRDINTATLQIRRTQLPADWPDELRQKVASVSMVRRLREVRALLGFRRLSPSSDNTLVPVNLGDAKVSWLPGVEAWGEGIFVQLSEQAVKAWEAKAAASLQTRFAGVRGTVERMGWHAATATPRFSLIHTLAHALIRRLSFDAGYSASSIRERIFSSPEGQGMCGILLYTADGDSEGSLGGLVRLGDPVRFGRLLVAAMQDMSWCSADPVCRETSATGIDGLNAASCHACALVSETSCSFNNCVLDRRTLVPVSGVPAFFDLDALMGNGETSE